VVFAKTNERHDEGSIKINTINAPLPVKKRKQNAKNALLESNT
jgi:hypothetical protein